MLFLSNQSYSLSTSDNSSVQSNCLEQYYTSSGTVVGYGYILYMYSIHFFKKRVYYTFSLILYKTKYILIIVMQIVCEYVNNVVITHTVVLYTV
jgi:hypothetical protein